MTTGPLSALHITRTLVSINNWMQSANMKLNELMTIVTRQSTSQFPPITADQIQTLLDNQKVIMGTLVQHGSVIDELVKEVKDLKQDQATTASIDALREDVKKIAACDLPFDMFIGDSHPHLPPQTSQLSSQLLG
ncbi:hypothetical protein A4A49_21355 [Nicotiana attenuata]|uniref:Uncharacterized protein n=1 Tax=Nicotiana attenuata TaxID=49451 RepID=A0A1J6I923_NICAT|nr:hypothetical protein A4A49_21355 [Nicotiana attenuata]